MGRSRGGLTTKIHALVDAAGLPLVLKLTEGQAHDGRSAHDMLGALVEGQTLLADRAYDSVGRLVSRQLPGAVHHDPETIIAQALTLARGEPLQASDGSDLLLSADTLCVHGDNASSVAAVQRIRQALGELPN